MAAEILALELRDDDLVGALAVPLAPGTVASARDHAIDAVLSARLAELAASAGAVLSAPSSAFAFPRPGKDEQGRTCFDVLGRIEGDRLIPRRPRATGKKKRI